MGRLRWEWLCFSGFMSFIVNRSIPRSFLIIFMVITELWPSWSTMDAMGWQVFRQNSWFRVGSDLGETGWQPQCISVVRWWMAQINWNKDTKYYSLGHNRAMTGRYMGHIYGNHMDNTQINIGCRGYAWGGLEWEWECFGGFVSFIVNESIPRSL